MSGQATGWVLRNGPRPDMIDRNGEPYGQRARGYRMVLVAIADAANRDGEHAHPGNEAICESALYGRRQVSNIIAELVAERWVEVVEEGGGRGRATVYRLSRMAEDETMHSAPRSTKPNRAIEETKPRDDEPETAHSGGETAHSGVRANGVATEQTNGRDTTEAAPPLALVLVPSPSGPMVDAFDEFWSAYPMKRGKPAARHAFASACKRAPAAEIIAGAARYAADPNRSDAFTKWAQGWLREDRWNDPPLPSRTGAPNPNAGIDTDRGGPTGLVDWRTS